MTCRTARPRFPVASHQRAAESIERQRRKHRRGWTVQVYEDQLRFARGLRNALLLTAAPVVVAFAIRLLTGR